LRIVQYTDTPRIGGAERYLAHLTAAALEAGHEVVTVSPQQEVADWIAEQAPGAGAVRLGDRAYHEAPSISRRALLLARAVPALRSTIKRLRPDLVHVNNGGYPGSDLSRVAAIASRGTAPRRLMTVHSMPWSRTDSQPQVQALVDRGVWSSLTDVLCPARLVGHELSRTRGMPERMLHHVPYGVDTPRGAGQEAERLRVRLAPDGGPLLGMVSGTTEPEKGHDVFAHAVASVAGARGILVGPHPGERFERLLRDLGMTHRIAVEGPFSEVAAYYYAIDALVLPSTAYECLPLVILEAMAAERPVFASRLSGIPEAVEHGRTGYLFEPGSTAELTSLLREALPDRERMAELGRAARVRWEQDFSVPVLKANGLRVYEDHG
jgi:glycosyltransferase involved in cell wall biosynthesis